MRIETEGKTLMGTINFNVALPEAINEIKKDVIRLVSSKTDKRVTISDTPDNVKKGESFNGRYGSIMFYNIEIDGVVKGTINAFRSDDNDYAHVYNPPFSIS